jgi:hypothetical protein
MYETQIINIIFDDYHRSLYSTTGLRAVSSQRYGDAKQNLHGIEGKSQISEESDDFFQTVSEHMDGI